MSHDRDTIYALASAPGQSGLAVVRVSGPAALDSLKALSGLTPRPRHAHFAKLTYEGKPLDEGVCLYFQGPNSYTGEDTVEYMLHGSRAVITDMLDILSDQKNHRMAEAGEFTKRAFMNGRLDLTEAEAVADLIHAETEAQRIMALNQLGGTLHKLYEGWTQHLAKALAHQEAEIEFPDEDMPDGIDDAARIKVQELLNEINAHLDDDRKGERLRTGLKITIFGAPNAGKSSLLNWLAGRDAAIVTDIPGTTRDVVEVQMNLGGYPVILSDTAGLRDDYSDAVEQEGIKRARARIGDADISIGLYDAKSGLDDMTANSARDNSLIIANKIDQVSGVKFDASHGQISVKTGAGLSDFLKDLEKRVCDYFNGAENTALITRERHRAHLLDAQAHLKRALQVDLPELAAEDLRQALLSLGRITGHVDVEALLDIVFKDFCIGK